MGDHLKRLNAPDSWHIAKKTTKFITKTAPGPHNANAMPIAVWLRDHLDHQLSVLLGRGGPFAQCSEDEHIGPREAKADQAPPGWWEIGNGAALPDK